jgi:hypothetical protein
MITVPSVTSVALLVALSLFLGLAFEDFFARTDTRRPGAGDAVSSLLRMDDLNTH